MKLSRQRNSVFFFSFRIGRTRAAGISCECTIDFSPTVIMNDKCLVRHSNLARNTSFSSKVQQHHHNAARNCFWLTTLVKWYRDLYSPALPGLNPWICSQQYYSCFMCVTISVEPSHRWAAFFCCGTWQLSMPGFSLGTFRWHQTGCLLGNFQEVEKQAGDSQAKFYLCLLSSILKYFKAQVLFWQIWGIMRLCFVQIVKDSMKWKMKNSFCDLHYFFSLWANKGMGVQWLGHWWFYNFKGVCWKKK